MKPPPPASAIVLGSDSAVQSLSSALGASGITLTVATSADELLAGVARGAYELAFVEERLAPHGVAALAAELSGQSDSLRVVGVFPADRVQDGVDAVRRGLFDFIKEPIDADEVRYVVTKALAGQQSEAEEPPPPSRAPASRLLGQSAVMQELRAEIRRVARSLTTVLIRGETGTGKELVARSIHDESDRAGGPFVKVHCGALPDNLLESELFGYERGAFTGATQKKPGRVDLAERGTLFLDEIGDITPLFQLKLLRLLQDREFEPLGGTQTRKADVRFVAATHRDLESMVEKGTFRADLFYRLNVVPLDTPALCDHPEDFDALAIHFCNVVAAQNGRPAVALDVAALDRLKARPWPGNVRELLHFVERLVVLCQGPRISLQDVDRELARRPTAMGFAAAYIEQPKLSKESSVQELNSALLAAERRALEKALRHANGNRDAAARLLNISRRALYYKLREHGIS